MITIWSAQENTYSKLDALNLGENKWATVWIDITLRYWIIQSMISINQSNHISSRACCTYVRVKWDGHVINLDNILLVCICILIVYVCTRGTR